MRDLMRAFALLLFLPAFLSAEGQVSVGCLRTEFMDTPLNIESAHPRLNWVIESGERDVRQTAYRVVVASTEELLRRDKGDLWDTGVVPSDQSVNVSYEGAELTSNMRCYWKVKVFTTAGESEWSAPAAWGMGLLGETRWEGHFIGWDAPFAWDEETLHSRLSARYVRKEFATRSGTITRATAHICGLGLYELFINGKRVGEGVLAPAPTDYRRIVLYNTFDITDLVAEGDNAIGVTLGNGRYYAMRQNYKPYKINDFGYPKMRLNVIIEYADGSVQRVNSDETWRLTADGPIRSNNEYDGEEYDARKDLGAWTSPCYNDSSWLPAQRVAVPTGALHGNTSPNMKVMRRVAPVAISRYGDRCIIDFGQNMAGWVRMRVRRQEEGDTITLRYAERLKGRDSLDTRNLRDALSTDTYICSGREDGGSWAPVFSYHGFRYVEVSGYNDPEDVDFTAELVYDEMETAGSFVCSNDMINTVCRNAWWTIASNYKGMPVDCPQRNERQPWLGDRTGGARGESFLFGNHTLYAKWMDDICRAQREDGCIPDVAPPFWNYYTDNVTWPAALPVICDMLYEQYGDTLPISRCYGALTRWTDHIRKEYADSGGIVRRDKYGDWCVPPAAREVTRSRDMDRTTDGALIATAYYYKALTLLEKFASSLRRDGDAERYAAEAEAVRACFNETFLTVKKGSSPVANRHLLYPDSVFYGNNTLTANILPIAFGIVPDTLVQDVEDNIVTTIMTTHDGHACCGVIGMQWLMHCLTRMGRGDVAFLIATNKTYPSYGYMAENGATTIWELWNGDTASPKMNSGNHVMLLGDFISWLFRDLAGIWPAQPGYKTIVMRPDFSIQELDSVSATYNTPYGTVESKWTKDLRLLTWDITVPCNACALIRLPATDISGDIDGISLLCQEEGGSVWRVPSGAYHLSADISMTQGRGNASDVQPALRNSSVPDSVQTCTHLNAAFLYEEAPFPSCHAATIEETADGSLVTAFFGGTRERAPDCRIYVCRRPAGEERWTAPVAVAEGKDSTGASVACWNPVLSRIPGTDELILFYKTGKSVKEWIGWTVRSVDGGRTWGAPERLPDGFIGPTKNKPVYVNGRMICPSSTEGKDGWKAHFELSDDYGVTWRLTAPDDAERSVLTQDRCGAADSTNYKPVHAIQPAVLVHKDGSLQALCRTRNAKIAETWSHDNGETWTTLSLTDLPSNNSGIDAVATDGQYVLVYNDFETLPCTPKGARTPLSVAVSDDGNNWTHAITLEDSPIGQYSYPSVIKGNDGSLHIVYTWRRQRIKYVNVKL